MTFLKVIKIKEKVKKNVVIVLYSDRAGGGAENYLEMMAEKFASDGYIIHIFFAGKKTTDRYTHNENYRLYQTSIARNILGVPLLIRNLFRARKKKFDYAFTSLIFLSFLVGILRRLGILKINYFVGRESTTVFNRFKGIKLFLIKMFYRFGYSAIDLLICQTQYMKQQLLENLPWLEKKVNIQVIPNPVDIANMLSRANENVGFNYDYPYIVSAGRFVPVKGFDILINAFSKLKKEHNELKLVMLGEMRNMGEYISRIIRDLHLENDVILHGLAENVYPFFKNAKMCVVSSRIEGFPNVLLQMMSQNEKVVSTLCAGGIDELEGVFTCKTNDEDDLFRAMKECLDADTGRNREIFDRELQSRSIDKFVEKIMDYEKAKC